MENVPAGVLSPTPSKHRNQGVQSVDPNHQLRKQQGICATFVYTFDTPFTHLRQRATSSWHGKVLQCTFLSLFYPTTVEECSGHAVRGWLLMICHTEGPHTLGEMASHTGDPHYPVKMVSHFYKGIPIFPEEQGHGIPILLVIWRPG